MEPMDVSINMISLFAFIVTLGIVVDDAIVAGEAIYYERERGTPPILAAIRGVRSVAAPITFSIITTMVAFTPMLFVPGASGKFFRVIPLVVIAVLGVSLVEALLILPAHLSGLKERKGKIYRGVVKVQSYFTGGLRFVIDKTYHPTVRAAVRWRWTTLGIFIALMVIAAGFVAGGRINFIFIPDIESDIIQANVEMPFGSASDDTERVVRRLVDESHEVFAELGDEDMSARRGIYARVGEQEVLFGGDPTGGGGNQGSHIGQVQLSLVGPDDRSFTSGDFTQLWRERVSQIPGVDTINFTYKTGPAGGKAITLELSHHDQDLLEEAARQLATELQGFGGVFDVDDGVEIGKQQIDFELKPAARQLGISEANLAQQLRGAFYGAEAARQQRGRYEVRTYVRLPEEQRTSLEDLEDFIIRTPQGGEIPLRQAATLDVGRSFTTIQREDGRRTISVTADVDSAVTTAGEVVGSIERNFLPELQQRYEGLGYSLGGDQEQQAESIEALQRGFILAILAMYFLMGVAFKSYSQPLVIMSAIPFGFIGALAGHVVMGMKLSLMSMFGIVALSGVVVNDSLVLISAVNDYRRDEGMGITEAVIAGGVRRFRPILLTSLTTFFGLSPMILETSVQAKFLIPMAVSLGFGVLFATAVILILVPALYRALEDIRLFFAWLFGRDVDDHSHPPGGASSGPSGSRSGPSRPGTGTAPMTGVSRQTPNTQPTPSPAQQFNDELASSERGHTDKLQTYRPDEPQE
jgi:multidrug efflux pump subunit AcrB